MNSPNSSTVRSPYLDECAQIPPLDFESEGCPKQPCAGCGRGGSRAGSRHPQEWFWAVVRYRGAPESPDAGSNSPLLKCLKSGTQLLRMCLSSDLADREEHENHWANTYLLKNKQLFCTINKTVALTQIYYELYKAQNGSMSLG